MSFKYLKQMPTPEEVKRELPLPEKYQKLKKERDAVISDIITGKDDRFLVIIGPCSADNEDAVLRLYPSSGCRVRKRWTTSCYIIPRIYTNKPRTTGDGYKGIASPAGSRQRSRICWQGSSPCGSCTSGPLRRRGFTCADEMLYPENWRYRGGSALLRGHRRPVRGGSASPADRQRLRCGRPA